MKMLTYTPKEINKLTDLDLVKKRAELTAILDDGKTLLGTINERLLTRLEEQKTETLTIGGYTVSKVKRLSFSQVPLEFAKKFRAIKKVADASVLTPLYHKGITIPGAIVAEYVMVRKEK